MTDMRVTHLAQTLVHYCIKSKPGDKIAVIGKAVAEPLLLEIQREILRSGAHPHMIVMLEGSDYITYSEANQDQLTYISPFRRLMIEEFDGMIQLMSDSNTKRLSNVDPAKQQLSAKSQAELFKTYMQRSATGDLQWVIAMYPTNAYAQDAEMSLAEFEDYVYTTTYSDLENPVAEWNRIHDEQQRLVDWLAGKKKVVVNGPNVDLSLSIEGRPFINSDGSNNMPSGEIFTSPIENSINGWIKFTYPAILQAREVEGIEIHLKDGHVEKATAEKNEEFLNAMLDVDEGARGVGEFAIGTNKRIDRFIKSILFDEKIGGTIHMAFGAGFPECGSKNVSAIHWDMICDMRDGGKIFVDDELFYDSGEFKI
ncbi:MAG: aminopeptidase [Anaerolineales bacterium]|nr:aminopeptidase [Anaerolineales bacterium]